MTEPHWVSAEFIHIAHNELINLFGGSAGVRDQGLLDSALARPQNLAAYGDPSVADLAAAYAYGIASNHPFVDGNKRTAFAAAHVFLKLNGWELRAPQAEATIMIRDLAAGDIDEATLAAWIGAHLEPRNAGG